MANYQQVVVIGKLRPIGGMVVYLYHFRIEFIDPKTTCQNPLPKKNCHVNFIPAYLYDPKRTFGPLLDEVNKVLSEQV